MYKQTAYAFLLCLLLLSSIVIGQNESKKWYFGSQAGLDFMTSPPTPLTCSMNPSEGCASIADNAGNTLFYTDGATIFNSTHVSMANGTGLNGNGSTSQSSLILKQPGGSVYYVFTLSAGTNCTLKYSIVDMTLASGMGSVTVKNTQIATGLTERLTGTRHCNGTDYWIVVHAMNSADFQAFQFSAGGVSAFPVISTIGSVVTGGAWVGCMRISPNGQKIATGHYGGANVVELFDFSNTSGVVSNSLQVASLNSAYGVEFSPDASKLYATAWFGTAIHQWDLCAGSGTAIVASDYLLPTVSGGKGSLQLAPDGKIYAARSGQNMLGVISNPNIAGSGCNYTETGQSIAPKSSTSSLPNFINFYKPPTPPFTHTVSNLYGCQTASFNAPPIVQTYSIGSCTSTGYSLMAIAWNFGDPLSGAANTSTLTNPFHSFSALGTYTAQMIVYFSCGGGNDTITQIINVNQPCISVSSTSITCASLGSATVQATGGIGPFSYTWMPGNQTNSVATGLSPGTYTLTVFDFGNNYTYTASTVFTSLIPLSGLINNSPSITCNGAATGTANVTGLTGGSGLQNYLWTNGVSSYTAPNPTNLPAGNYTATVTDALTGCTISGGFFISQPAALNLNVTASSASLCSGETFTLTGNASGGTPYTVGSAYNYTWTGGPASYSYAPNQTVAGNYVYSLSARDAYSCMVAQTVTVAVVANPTLSLSNALICPLQTGTITVLGASTYTWNGGSTGNSFSDNPLVNTSYPVIGSAAGCTASATGSIGLKPVPVPTLSTNGPRCNGSALLLNGSGGVSYNWTGPAFYSSSVQNPTINPVNAGNAGVYNLTVTAANGCTASTNATVVVNPTPSVSAAGSTVCTSKTISLTSSSSAGATFSWTGPSAFGSALQNPLINNAVLNQAGSYTVKATSVNGCTNTAIAQVGVVLPPAPAIAISNNTLCAQAFNGSPNAISATLSGANTYTLSAPANISISNPSGPVSSLTSAAPFPAGPVTISLTGSNGVCSVTTSASFSILANPVVTITAPNPVICEGRSYTFTSQGASSYTWAPNTGSMLSYSSGAMVVVSPTLSTLFTVIGSSVGCNSATQGNVLTVNPLPLINLSAPSATICLNNNVLLSVSGTASSYSWNPSTGLNAVVGSSVIAGPPANQNYTITASLNSCTSTALMSVYVLPLPQPVLILPKPAVCLNETLTLQASGGVSYSWKDPIGFVRSGQSLYYNFNNVGYTGNYTLVVTDLKGCMSATIFPMVVNDLPVARLAGSQMKACVPFCSDFNLSYPGAFSATLKINGQLFAGNSFSYCFNQAGNYPISADIQDAVTGCLNTQYFTVNAWPLPKADFEFYPQVPVENADEVIFSNTSSGDGLKKWSWHFINNQGYRTERENASYIFQQAGIYPVAMIVTNSLGCSDSVVKNIEVAPDFNIYVPEAFTPNGDGLNETFAPVMRGVKSFTLKVFDRWGEKLFETSDLNGGWDGQFKGKACKEEFYVWKLEAVAENQASNKTGKQQKSLSGQVLLYR